MAGARRSRSSSPSGKYPHFCNFFKTRRNFEQALISFIFDIFCTFQKGTYFIIFFHMNLVRSSRRSRTVSTDLSKKMREAAKKEFRINLVPDFSDEHLIPEDKLEEAWQIYAPGKDRINYPDFRGA